MPVRRLLELSLLTMCLVACVTAGGQSVRAATSAFHYDPATGTCKNTEGAPGLNPADPAALFVNKNEETNTYTGGDAECVDFTGFNFQDHIGLGYPMLAQWNFRGAKFETARFFFANVSESDFSGADLRGLKYGYATLSGVGDAFTQGDSCPVGEGYVIQCTR
jgi:hypothetical protein